MGKSLSEELAAKIMVRFYKREQDDRTLLCGSHVETDESGRQFFAVPVHQKDYISKILPQYEVGDEFIPREADAEK